MDSGLKSGRGKIYFNTSDRPGRSWGPSTILFNEYRNSYPGVKLQGREADHSSQSNPDDKNKRNYASTPSMLRAVNTDRFILSGFSRSKCIIQSNVNCASVHSAFCKAICFETLYVTNKQTNIRANKVSKTPKNYENTTNQCK
jgi:hypothetical protein